MEMCLLNSITMTHVVRPEGACCLPSEHGHGAERPSSAPGAGVVMSTAEHAGGGELFAVRVTGMKKVVISSVIGTAVEWYDFLIYGTASALVFTKLFFPSSNPGLSAIASFGTLGVGFFARPLGAAIFGHFGDRFGRKAMLAMTIVIMGLGTFLIGVPAPVLAGPPAPVPGRGARRRMGRRSAHGGRECADQEPRITRLSGTRISGVRCGRRSRRHSSIRPISSASQLKLLDRLD